MGRTIKEAATEILPQLKVDKTSLTMAFVGGKDTVLVSSSVEWKLSALPAWITANTLSGGPGDSKLILSISPQTNSVDTARVAILTITSATSSLSPVNITVNQTKFNSVIFSNLFGGGNLERFSSVVKTLDGGFISVGYTNSYDKGEYTSNHGEFDVLVVKTDKEGKKQWTKLIGGSGVEDAVSVVVSSDGGFVIAGTTDSNDGDFGGTMPPGNKDIFVSKLDGNGNIKWVKKYGGGRDDESYAMVSTEDGGFAVTGVSDSDDGEFSGAHSPNTSGDVFLLKLDANGNKRWVKLYGASGGDMGTAVATTQDGFIITGNTNSSDQIFLGNHGKIDAFIIKVDINGIYQWAKILGGSREEEANSVVAVSDGYVLTGNTYSNDQDIPSHNGALTNSDFFVAKLSLGGDKEWIKVFGSSGFDLCNSIVAVSNAYVLCGSVGGNDHDFAGTTMHGDGDAFVLKIDKSGNRLWSKTFGGSGLDEVFSIIDGGEGYVLGGHSSSANGDLPVLNNGIYDAWLLQVTGK